MPKLELQLWWIPQVPMKPFTFDVPNIEVGKLMLDAFAKYDLFQLANRIKPDYANAGGLRFRFAPITGDDWHDVPDDEEELAELEDEIAYFGGKKLTSAMREAAAADNRVTAMSSFFGEMVEQMAKEIYATFEYNEPGAKPEWVTGGNSLMQDEARRQAMLKLEEASAEIPMTTEDMLDKLPEAILKGGK